MDKNTQRLVHTFSALADLGQEIAGAGNFEEMLDTSFHVLLGSLAIRRGAVAAYDVDRKQMRFVVTRGLDDLSPELSISDQDETTLVNLTVVALTEEQVNREGLEFLKPVFEAAKIQLVVPLIVRRQLIGLVLLGEKATGDAFTAEDAETICGRSGNKSS